MSLFNFYWIVKSYIYISILLEFHDVSSGVFGVSEYIYHIIIHIQPLTISNHSTVVYEHTRTHTHTRNIITHIYVSRTAFGCVPVLYKHACIEQNKGLILLFMYIVPIRNDTWFFQFFDTLLYYLTCCSYTIYL